MRRRMITLHAYGTWMPDKPKGFAHRQHGLLPTNRGLAGAYRKNQAEATVYLNGDMQRMLIESSLDSMGFLDTTPLVIATEPTHLHIVFAWGHERDGAALARSIRLRLTRDLNLAWGRRAAWWTAKGRLSPVKDDAHLAYLRSEYLPSHRGWKWDGERGLYR
ncbi:MAG: hypothetical protein AAGD32_10250 [Planctomycetota bacterium]